MGNSYISVKKLVDVKSIRDFGGLGDGSSDDTAAFSAAASYFYTTGLPVYVPPGTYLTDPFTVNHNGADPANTFGFFFGDNEEKTTIKRRTNGVGAFITVGSISNTTYISNMWCSNIKFDGGITTNGPTMEMNRVVRTAFDNVKFSGGTHACKVNEAINVTFKDCNFANAGTGLMLTSHNSSIDASPNNVNIYGGFIGDNTVCGINFNYGRLLNLDGVEIEGNGTTLADVNQGGILVGTSVGGSDSAAIPLGLVARSCWFEANKGIADVYLQSGQNALTDCIFWSQATGVTNDVRITGGRYTLTDCYSRISKSANVFEGGSVLTGNFINGCAFSNLTWSTSKTTVITSTLYTPSLDAATSLRVRSGNVPSAWFGGATLTNPVILTGSTTCTSADKVVTIGTTMSSNAYTVHLTPYDTGAYAPTHEIVAKTTTTFTVRPKAVAAGGTITTTASAFDWLVIGTAA